MFTFTSSKLESLAGSHLEVKVVALNQVKARPGLFGQLANVGLQELLWTSLLAFLLAVVLVPISCKQNLKEPSTKDIFYLHILHSRKACSVSQSCQSTTLESYLGKVPGPCNEYEDLYSDCIVFTSEEDTSLLSCRRPYNYFHTQTLT